MGRMGKNGEEWSGTYEVQSNPVKIEGSLERAKEASKVMKLFKGWHFRLTCSMHVIFLDYVIFFLMFETGRILTEKAEQGPANNCP